MQQGTAYPERAPLDASTLLSFTDSAPFGQHQLVMLGLLKNVPACDTCTYEDGAPMTWADAEHAEHYQGEASA